MSLTFDEFRKANLARCIRFRDGQGRLCHPNGVLDWPVANWFMALLGELGELANYMKKYDRGDFLWTHESQLYVERELGDVQTYLDLLAARLDVNLGRATLHKFNEVSDRVGADVKLVERAPFDMQEFEDLLKWYADGAYNDQKQGLTSESEATTQSRERIKRYVLSHDAPIRS